MNPSRLRQKIRALYEQIAPHIETVLARDPLFAASLYEHNIKCGKPQCKCAKGSYRHHLWCVSFNEQGRSRTRVVSETQYADVERLTGAYARFRQARREIQQACQALLTAVDALGRARCEQGQKRYTRVAAKGKRQTRSRGGATGGSMG